jgi:uncharacterized protein (DUF58 family)
LPRPGRRALGLTLGSILLFVIGTNNQAGWLLVMSSLLMGAAVAGTVLPLLLVRHVEVERRSPTEAFQGEDVRIEIEVGNRGRGPKLSLAVEDPHVRPTTMWISHLGPGERATITTVRRATRRGLQQAEPLVVSSSAPFGVARSRRIVEADGQTLVYPRVVPLARHSLTGGFRPAHEQSTPLPQRGGGHDFLGVREYRVGDSMRHIHWASTARFGSLMVREFERENPHRVGILIDTLADIGVEETPLDLCCSAAASIAVASLGLGHTVDLLAARGGKVARETVTDPSAALTWLAKLLPDGGLSLPMALEEAAPVLRRCDTVVLAFPTWHENGAGRVRTKVRGVPSLGARVIGVVVRAETYEGVGRSAPVLTLGGVDALADALAGDGVAVRVVGAADDLGACLDRLQ